MSSNARAHQIISLYSYQPEVNFISDAVLATPRAIFPNDGSTFCPPTQSGSNSGIVLEWTASTDATEYIVQICRNSSFSGPTLRARTTTNTYYELQLRDDILIGETLFWRVMAKNASGGLSAKSLPRSVTYDCPIAQISGKGDSKAQGPSETTGLCQNYNVNMEMKGPEEVLCCDRQTYYLDVTYSCKDAWGRDIVTLDSVTWSRSQSDATVTIEDSSTESALVYFRAENSERITLKATATFTDVLNSTTFTCYVTKQVTIDCDTGIPSNKPWLFEYLPNNVKALDSHMPLTYSDFIRSEYEYLLSLRSLNDAPVLYPDWVGDTEGSATVDAGGSGVIPLQRFLSAGPVAKIYEHYSIPSEVPWNPVTGEVYSDYEYCFRVQNIGYTEEHVLESRTHGVVGCGLQVYSINGGHYILQANAEHLAGDSGSRKGLRPMDNSYCSLEVYYGCGLTFDAEKLVLDFDGIAGDGIGVDNSGTCPKLTADGDKYVPGCGLFYNSTTGTLDVERGDLIGSGNGLTSGSGSCDIRIDYGCGLTINGTSGALEVVPEDLAGAGLISGGSGCALDVNLGCGLTFDGDAIDVKGSQLAGDGLGFTGDCTLYFSYGKGLYTEGDKAFVYAGCGLEFDAAGRVKADAATMAGNGLATNDASNCELYVDTGAGIEIVGNKVRVKYDCGLKMSSGVLEVNNADLALQGLDVSGECGIRVGQGCGIAVGNDSVAVDATQLAAAGLITSSSCGLAVGQGCGISVSATEVSVNRADLIGLGLTADSGDCEIKLDLGCGLKFNSNEVEVDNSALAGDGLTATGSCALTVDAGDGLQKDPQLKANLGCGLQFNAGAIEVNNTKTNGIAGSGLTPGAGCAVDVDYGDGLTLGGNKVEVYYGLGLYIDPDGHLDFYYGPGLRINAANKAEIYYGCGLRLYNNKELRVDPPTLAGVSVSSNARGMWYNEDFNTVGGGCDIYPLLGYGLELGTNFAFDTKTRLQVNYGCGLGLESDPDNVDTKRLKVAAAQLAGPGLRDYQLDSPNCTGLAVQHGNGIRVVHDGFGGYSVDAFPEEFAGQALYSTDGYDLHVNLAYSGYTSVGRGVANGFDGKAGYVIHNTTVGDYSTSHEVCFYLIKANREKMVTEDGIMISGALKSSTSVDHTCFNFTTCNTCPQE